MTELNISYAGNSEVVSSESSVLTAPVAASSSSKVKPAVTPRKKRAGPISRSQQDCSGQGKCCTGYHRADLDFMCECKCPLCPSEAFLVPFTFSFPLLLLLTLLSSSSNHFNTTNHILPPHTDQGKGVRAELSASNGLTCCASESSARVQSKEIVPGRTSKQTHFKNPTYLQRVNEN